MNVYEVAPRFAKLFSGLDTAFGTGAGRWVKRPPRPEDFVDHLNGRGPGIGIAPLRPDNAVMFAAIDLDEADFDAAREMQAALPGASWLERSRSGNAHVWCFFKAPLEAWVAMGVLRNAIEIAGKEYVEVFPKNHDFQKVRLGNYINLPFHGKSRPIILGNSEIAVSDFLDEAFETANDPEKWRTRAAMLLVTPPDQREKSATFGDRPNLHICAEHVISGDAGPIIEGHRSVVYFSLAKMLTNWEQTDHSEIVDILRSVNSEQGRDSIPDAELLRIIGNAERGEYTSTGCDDPVFQAYAHPDCRIAHP